MDVHESAIVASIADGGLLRTYKTFTALNDAKILSFRSSDGWGIVRERALIVDTILKHWFSNLVRRKFSGEPLFEYALLAVGGYGRGELNPNSDIDLKLVVDDTKLERNPLVKAFTHEAHYKAEKQTGFPIEQTVHTFDALQGLSEKYLNPFLDMRVLLGSQDLEDRLRQNFRERYNRLELFLHNVAFLQEAQAKYPHSFDNVEQFNIKSGVGGLRNYHAAAWMHASESFSTSLKAYTEMKVPEEVLESVGLILQLRSWLNLHKERERRRAALEINKPSPSKGHNSRIDSDIFRYEDFLALKDALGEYALERLGFARRQIYNFTQAIMHEKSQGIKVGKDIFYGRQGLFVRSEEKDTPQARDDRMLALVAAAQRHRIPIDPAEHFATFDGVHRWALQSPLFAQLFFEKGSLYSSLKLLSEKNVLDKLIPGFTRLRTSLHDANHRARHLTRAGFALQKVKTLEDLAAEESEFPFLRTTYNSLEPEHAAGVKLALLVKHIPYVNPSLQSVLPQSLQEYLSEMQESARFPKETMKMAEFLIQNHNLLRKTARESLADVATINEVMRTCKDQEHLHALAVFTYVNHGSLDHGDSAHVWKSLDELVAKARTGFAGDAKKCTYDFLALDEQGSAIAQDLGPDFMSSIYSSSAPTWISYLSQVHQTGKPVVKNHRHCDSQLLGVACPDYPGLLAVITGQLFEAGANLRQAHAYSLSKHGLALDYFDVVPSALKMDEIAARLVEAIDTKRFIDRNPQNILSTLQRNASLEYRKQSGYYRLFFSADKDIPGILYALTSILYHTLEADIYGMRAYAPKGKKVEDYIFFNTPHSEDEARLLVREHIGESKS